MLVGVLGGKECYLLRKAEVCCRPGIWATQSWAVVLPTVLAEVTHGHPQWWVRREQGTFGHWDRRLELLHSDFWCLSLEADIPRGLPGICPCDLTSRVAGPCYLVAQGSRRDKPCVHMLHQPPSLRLAKVSLANASPTARPIVPMRRVSTGHENQEAGITGGPESNGLPQPLSRSQKLMPVET